MSGEAPNLVYTPKAGYHGSDAFSFKVTDGKAESDIATVLITVNSGNDVPAARAQSVTVNEDAEHSITLLGMDADGDMLTYKVMTPPTDGYTYGEAPKLIHTPTAGYQGSDAFSLKVKDGKTGKEIVQV